MNEVLQIVGKQGIKGPDVIVNVVWVKMYIYGYVMHNSLSIVAGNSQALHTSLGIFVPKLASIQWHAIGTE